MLKLRTSIIGLEEDRIEVRLIKAGQEGREFQCLSDFKDRKKVHNILD